MTHTKSSAKDLRRIKKRTARNRALRSALRTSLKKARLAVDSGSDDAAAKVKIALRTLDKMVTKGIITPNNAARRKSRLMKRFNTRVKGILPPTPQAKKVDAPQVERLSASDADLTA